MAGIIPVILIIVITMAGGCVVVDCVWGHVLFLAPAIVGLVGIVSLILLLRSKMAVQCLGQANAILRHNVEGKYLMLKEREMKKQYSIEMKMLRKTKQKEK